MIDQSIAMLAHGHGHLPSEVSASAELRPEDAHDVVAELFSGVLDQIVSQASLTIANTTATDARGAQLARDGGSVIERRVFGGKSSPSQQLLPLFAAPTLGAEELMAARTLGLENQDDGSMVTNIQRQFRRGIDVEIDACANLRGTCIAVTKERMLGIDAVRPSISGFDADRSFHPASADGPVELDRGFDVPLADPQPPALVTSQPVHSRGVDNAAEIIEVAHTVRGENASAMVKGQVAPIETVVVSVATAELGRVDVRLAIDALTVRVQLEVNDAATVLQMRSEERALISEVGAAGYQDRQIDLTVAVQNENGPEWAELGSGQSKRNPEARHRRSALEPSSHTGTDDRSPKDLVGIVL
jgi:hypothetical protein